MLKAFFSYQLIQLYSPLSDVRNGFALPTVERKLTVQCSSHEMNPCSNWIEYERCAQQSAVLSAHY